MIYTDGLEFNCEWINDKPGNFFYLFSYNGTMVTDIRKFRFFFSSFPSRIFLFFFLIMF